MKSSEKLVEKIFSRTVTGIELGLGRMEKVLATMGNPQREYSIIHVAGTNGKGTVCTLTEALLRSEGYSTGLYTSPHIVHFEERFRVNGKIVDSREWVSIYEEYEALFTQQMLTFFEITTVLAFELFKRKSLQWVVLETGLGGTYDATNVVTPSVVAITKIGFDHQEWLGNTIEQIAQEKLGIVKEGVPVVLDWSNGCEVQRLAEGVCEEKKAVLHKNTEIHGLQNTSMNKVLDLKRRLGVHYYQNSLTALKIVELIGVNLREDHSRVLQNCTISARYEKKRIDKRTFLFDVAHNEESMKSLCKRLKDEKGEWVILFGLCHDKEVTRIIECLDSMTIPLHFAPFSHSRSLQISQVQQYGSIVSYKSVEEALKMLQLKSCNICVTGSFYMVGEAYKILGIDVE